MTGNISRKSPPKGFCSRLNLAKFHEMPRVNAYRLQYTHLIMIELLCNTVASPQFFPMGHIVPGFLHLMTALECEIAVCPPSYKVTKIPENAIVNAIFYRIFARLGL
ncbi:hypothetical protein TNCV_5105221 [Trichonephila clavipes]|nr:hypothetical protein TNCV_5105221 [Trichonephila clavipes]